MTNALQNSVLILSVLMLVLVTRVLVINLISLLRGNIETAVKIKHGIYNTDKYTTFELIKILFSGKSK